MGTGATEVGAGATEVETGATEVGTGATEVGTDESFVTSEAAALVATVTAAAALAPRALMERLTQSRFVQPKGKAVGTATGGGVMKLGVGAVGVVGGRGGT